LFRKTGSPKVTHDPVEIKYRELIDAFSLFDKDGDGLIGAEEVVEILHSFGLTVGKQDIEEMLMAADLEGKGSIDADEFAILFQQIGSRSDLNEKQLKCAFQFLDHDNDGYIRPCELKTSMERMKIEVSENDMKNITEQLDPSNCGEVKISYSDFKKLLTDGYLNFSEQESISEQSPNQSTSPTVNLISTETDDEDKDSEILGVFQMFDKDGDGFISEIEVDGIFQSFGWKLKFTEIAAMVRNCDSQGDGLINFHEFKTIFSPIQKEKKLHDLRTAFNLLDKNKKGYISARDMCVGFTAMGSQTSNEEIFDIVLNLERKGFRKIDFEVFCEILS